MEPSCSLALGVAQIGRVRAQGRDGIPHQYHLARGGGRALTRRRHPPPSADPLTRTRTHARALAKRKHKQRKPAVAAGRNGAGAEPSVRPRLRVSVRFARSSRATDVRRNVSLRLCPWIFAARMSSLSLTASWGIFLASISRFAFFYAWN